MGKRTLTLLMLIAILLMHPVAGTTVIDMETSVGLWSFDEDDAKTAIDRSDKGNNGTIRGAKHAKGKFGKALRFNGQNDYVNCRSHRSLNPEPAITIAACVFVESWAGMGGADRTFIEKRNRGEPDASVYYLGALQGTIHFRLWTVKGPQELKSGSDSIELEEWYHLTGTYDGEHARLFINGEVVHEDEFGGDIEVANHVSLILGAGNQASASWYTGLLDEVAIFNVGLSEADVKELMGGIDNLAVLASNKIATTWAMLKSR